MDTKYLSMVGTFSKHPRAWGFDGDLVVDDASGRSLYLSDGRWYLDWVCGLGSNLLGYNFEPVVAAIQRQVAHGVGFSLPSRLEYHVAEKLVYIVGSRIPGFDVEDTRVRFAKTGSEATAMAVRLARAITGRDVILHCGYSGWASEFIAASPPAHGITVDQKRIIQTFRFNDLVEVAGKLTRRNVACVILEQGIVDPLPGYYDGLRKICDETGTLLVIDEVVTGLRYATGGASEKYGIKPDLVVMGKALGNGMPISAVLGRSEYLDWFNRDDPVFCSSTHWGEAASLAAANSVLDFVGDSLQEHLERLGGILMEYTKHSGWNVVGHPQRSLIVFESDHQKAFFIHGMRAQGVLMNRPNFVSYAHRLEDVDGTANAMAVVKEQWDKFGDQVVFPKEKIPHTLFKGR